MALNRIYLAPWRTKSCILGSSTIPTLWQWVHCFLYCICQRWTVTFRSVTLNWSISVHVFRHVANKVLSAPWRTTSYVFGSSRHYQRSNGFVPFTNSERKLIVTLKSVTLNRVYSALLGIKRTQLPVELNYLHSIPVIIIHGVWQGVHCSNNYIFIIRYFNTRLDILLHKLVSPIMIASISEWFNNARNVDIYIWVWLWVWVSRLRQFPFH